LRLGKIRPLQLLAGYLVLFIPKKSGQLRLCINYRQLNSIIKKDRYPLSLISKIQDRINNVQIFIKIDLRWAYYQIRIKEGDEWKGIFKTSKGLFKLIVLQFRFTNAPTTFQQRINSILGKHLDEFIMVYLNNIIIYLDLEEEYKKHVEWVLEKLHNKNIPIAIKKCEFHTRKTDFVKFIIKSGQINIDLKKIKAIVK